MSWTLKAKLSTELNLDPVPRESASEINPATAGGAVGRRLTSHRLPAPRTRTDGASAPPGYESPHSPWRPGQASGYKLLSFPTIQLSAHLRVRAPRELPQSPPLECNLHFLPPRMKIIMIAFKLYPTFTEYLQISREKKYRISIKGRA